MNLNWLNQELYKFENSIGTYFQTIKHFKAYQHFDQLMFSFALLLTILLLVISKVSCKICLIS
jgi:hypothetical protein